jgi:predicted Ser/Thr protein kinase
MKRRRFPAPLDSKMTTQTKAGRYEFIDELGRGAMGVVYKAMDPVIGRTVAVKTIRLSEQGTGLSRPELLTRFQTEARAAGLLTHPNIVVVYDAGEEDGLYFITMELVEGKSLQTLLDGGQAFPLPRVLRIMEQTCSALQFAHERNVVHRDIKPANLMLTADDTVKVTDFGTAKILQFGTVQQTAHVMGTPSYMSPEQVKGRTVDGRSDIFSLGVMLYEMVTGEKPFPGQNITTVIYKIVNEDPVPPRQIDPSIHPGLSGVVMKALAKEPDARYQSCREMFEDLRNYRSLAGAASTEKTMVLGGAGISATPDATVAISPGGGRGARGEDQQAAAAARSLTARASNPGQTPVLRRTGHVAPYEEPKKKNVVGTVCAALFLLGVIVYGGYKLRPQYEYARQLREAQKAGASASVTPSSSPRGAESSSAAVTPADPSASESAPQPKEPTPSRSPTVNSKPQETSAEKPTVRKIEPAVTSAAAEYKGRIEEAASEKGLKVRVKVQASGNTLTLAGKLRPGEHREMLQFLRNAPANVRVVDHIEYDDTPDPAATNDGDGGHPIPGAGHGAIHVLSDVIGATAVLHSPAGQVLNQCQTPCSFNNLNPARYGLEVKKDGYEPMQTALQVKSGDVLDQKIRLESLAKGLYVSSHPAGADVFINGAKQSGQTPVTLPLAPGQYNLVLRLPGYEAYAGSVQVKDNIQTTLDAELKEKGTSHVAWADVTSNPKGAEILIDGASTGQVSPSRVQVTAGTHIVTLKMDGYQLVRRTVQVTEGSTVTVDGTLRPK